MKILLDNGVEISVPKQLAQVIIDTLFISDQTPDAVVPVKIKAAKKPAIETDSESVDIVGRRSFSEAERDNIIEMRKRGFSAREISKKMHCKPAKIDQYLYQLRKKGLLADKPSAAEENNLEGL